MDDQTSWLIEEMFVAALLPTSVALFLNDLNNFVKFWFNENSVIVKVLWWKQS